MTKHETIRKQRAARFEEIRRALSDYQKAKEALKRITTKYGGYESNDLERFAMTLMNDDVIAIGKSFIDEQGET